MLPSSLYTHAVIYHTPWADTGTLERGRSGDLFQGRVEGEEEGVEGLKYNDRAQVGSGCAPSASLHATTTL